MTTGEPVPASGRLNINQNPFMQTRPSPSRMYYYKWMFKKYYSYQPHFICSLVKRWIQSSLEGRLCKGNNWGRPLKIYAPHGSFIIFNKRYFASGGDFNSSVICLGREFSSLRLLGGLNYRHSMIRGYMCNMRSTQASLG